VEVVTSHVLALPRRLITTNITRSDAVLIALFKVGTREMVVTFGPHPKFLSVSTRRILWAQKVFAPHMEQGFALLRSFLVIVVEVLAAIMTKI